MKIESAGRAAMLRGLVGACSKGMAILYGEGGPSDLIASVQLQVNAMVVVAGGVRLASAAEGQTGASKTAVLKGILVVDKTGAPVMSTENVEPIKIYENSMVSINDIIIPVKFISADAQ